MSTGCGYRTFDVWCYIAVHLYRAELLTKSYQTCTNPHPSLLLHNPNTHVYIHHDTPLHQHDTCVVVVTIVQIHWDYATVIHNHYTTKPAHDSGVLLAKPASPPKKHRTVLHATNPPWQSSLPPTCTTHAHRHHVCDNFQNHST